MKKIIIINGPNINMLGTREIKIYGKKTINLINKKIKSKFKNIKINFFQSNSESKIINKIHKIEKKYHYIIINPAGFSYNNVAILDALLSIKTPYIEVHISNIYNRDNFRSKSIFSKYAIGLITGFGYKVYFLALNFLRNNKKFFFK